MKVFWAWQSDHPREISRDVVRTALEAAIEHLKQEKDVYEAPEESRLHLDHDTKGLTGSPDVAAEILKKIMDCTIFVGDLSIVGKTPDKEGNEGVKPGRPLINSNVAIEYGFALRKLTDSAVVGVMNCIYECDFRGFSYGFRPGRGAHDALDALATGILRKKVNWVLDADIRGFFDTIDHGWLIKFIEHRIADRRVLRLIQKWLRAGVMEEGKRTPTEVGSPQGATASPLLANILLDEVDRELERRGHCFVRYADD